MDEILVDPTTATGAKPFNNNGLKMLVNMISGQEGDISTQVNSLKTSTATNPITAADLRAKTYQKSADQSIIVRLGGLDWIVTYVSNDTSGNLIATLWLSNNHQEAWGYTGQTGDEVVDSTDTVANRNLGDYYGIVNGGLYSDWSADCDDIGGGIWGMYGTSYIRVETLNNPDNRSYVVDEEGSICNEVAQDEDHIFSLYTDKDKKLTDYLSTPNKMSWINNLQDPTWEGTDSDVYLDNESLAIAEGSGRYSNSSEAGYTNWGSDYLWLPSLREVGAGENGASGLWQLNPAERATYDGSTDFFTSGTGTFGSSQTTYETSRGGTWTRSYTYGIAVARASDGSCCHRLRTDGVGSHYSYYVNASIGVRPCMLLNLTKAVESLTTAEISLDKQGGAGGDTSVFAIKNSTLPTLTTVPTHTGYPFGGYFTEPNGQGTKIYNADGTPAVTASPFESDTTLYAYWTWYDIKSVAGSTTTYSIFDEIDSNRKNGSLIITPATGHKVSEISFNNTNWYPIVRFEELITNSPIAIKVEYSANESLNSLYIEFKGIATTTAVPIYLKTTSGAYSGLKNSGSVSGVVVTATLGGMAYIVGDDFENLGDTDTITVSTKLCQPGYTFVGWYLDDDRTTAVSTATSYRVTKSVAYEHTLVAVYQSTSGSGVNLDVDNSG